MENNSIAILETSSEKIRNNDVAYKYRQCSNFFYLTGHNDPEGMLILKKSSKTCKSFFFTKKPTKEQQIWTGPTKDKASLKKVLEIDVCEYTSDIKKILPKIMTDINAIYHSLDKESAIIKILETAISDLENKYRRGLKYPSKTISLKKIIHNMRLIKSSDEIEKIKKACNISVSAHKRLMSKCRPGLTEYEMESEIIYEFKLANSQEAYPSIVASGKNARILHYTKNNRKMRDGDLLLVDAAAEFDNYASDITRTIPVNGKFTKHQKNIYKIVLNAQKNAISKCVAGNSWIDVHNEAIKTITKGLISLGLIKQNFKEAIKKKSYEKFYMHETGHWLGLDVHDPSEYLENDKWLKLKPGMVFTVEPGIYINDSKEIPKHFHNIGIRIEDDIFITNQGPKVLTNSLPKEINEIEKMVGIDA